MANMMISIEDTPDGKSVILRITSDPLFEIIKELSEGNCSIAQRMGAAALDAIGDTKPDGFDEDKAEVYVDGVRKLSEDL